MRSPKRGILIIVNNIHFMNKPRLRRNGAETDRDNLVHVFRQMGFFVCVQEDLTKLVRTLFSLFQFIFIHTVKMINNSIQFNFIGIFGSIEEHCAQQRHSVIRLFYVCRS